MIKSTHRDYILSKKKKKSLQLHYCILIFKYEK